MDVWGSSGGLLFGMIGIVLPSTFLFGMNAATSYVSLPMKNSIVIPTYTNFDGLKTCIDSISKTTTFGETDVWIVFNGAPPEALSWAEKLPIDFHAIVCREPLGFTRAANIGMVASKGENIILLNDDTAILDWGKDNKWVRMLVEPLKDESVAVTGSTMDYWARNKPFLVFFCAAMRRAMAKEMGYLDEAFNPGAGEDADFCLKAQEKGYKILQVPEQMTKWETRFPIWHVGHKTCGDLASWDQVSERNTRLLESRYPRTDEDRIFQVNFSKGLQNYDLWT